MSFIDIAILGILLISALFAFRRGFTRETIAIFAWIATGVGTYFAYPWVQPLAHNAIPFSLVADIIALFVTFFGFLTVLTFVSNRVARGLNAAKPGQIDRALGFAFGLGRGLVVVAGAFWLLGFSAPNQEPPAYVAEANLFPLVDATAQTLTAFVPQRGAPGARGVAYASDPAYEAPAGPAEENGYADSERQALDQLIESTSGD